MTARAGTAFVDVQPRITKAFGASLGGKLTGVMGKVGAVAGTALIGSIAAATGAGIKGVIDFAGFEKSMNEVFTLLPGISGEAMDQMAGQVQDLSKEFGVLPDEVVPALYQSLSAGVPRGNVFDFLETAQKTAIGGATDVETAVDGLTTITNAWKTGAEGADAAADAMFTAMRLGKTTVGELSSSMSSVAPIASNLGISFQDVLASTATLTKQGQPTGEAMNGIRAALVAMTKPSKNMTAAWEALGFESGRAAIETLGFQGAVEALRGHTEETGLEMVELTGRVEGANTILGLTGKNAEVAQSDLEALGDSGGAFADAFAQMDQGLSRSWDKIKATFANAFLDINRRLAPFVQTFSDFLADKLPVWIDTGMRAFEAISQWWSANGPAITQAVQTTFGIIGNVIGGIVGVIQTIIGWFQQARTDSESSFGGIAAFVEETWPKVQEIIQGVMEVIRTVIETVTKIVQAIWSQHGERIMAITTAVWDTVKTVITTVIGVIQGIIDVVMGLITGDWDRAWDGIKGILSSVWEGIKGIIENALGVIKNVIPIALDFIQEVWERVWDTIVGLLGAIWDDITDAISDGIEDVKSFFAGLPGDILDWLGDMGSLLFNVGKDIIRGLWDGLKDMWSNVTGWFSGLGSSIVDLKGPPDEDARLLTENGRLIMDGFQKGLTSGWNDVERFLDSRNAILAGSAAVETGGMAPSYGNWNFYGTPETMVDDLMRRQDRELRMTS